MNGFSDLGSGWFLYENSSDRMTIICDALSTSPNHQFGPAAWDGRHGPLSGRTILKTLAMTGGEWGQAGPDEWRWFSDDGQEFVEPPPSWPRVIQVEDIAFESLLSTVSGRVVSTSEELAELCRAVTAQLPKRDLPCVSAEIRAQAAKFFLPEIFGEND